MGTERVLDVVEQTEDYLRVKLRNLYSPMYVRMAEIAKPITEFYIGDLCHDTLTLARSDEGDKFIWAPRNCGTQLYKLIDSKESDQIVDLLIMAGVLPENVYLLEVKTKRGLEADGFVTWVHAQDWNHVLRVITDNMPN